MRQRQQITPVYQTIERVHFSFKMQYLKIIIKKLIILTEATNGKQMRGFSEPDMEKMPKKKFWQYKEDFRAEQIQATLPLPPPVMGCNSKDHHTHTECISQHSCLDLKGEKNVKQELQIQFPKIYFLRNVHILYFLQLNIQHEKQMLVWGLHGQVLVVCVGGWMIRQQTAQRAGHISKQLTLPC